MVDPFFFMDLFESGYIGLFVVCFLSATILPLTSEGALILMPAAGYDPVIALIVASAGNIIGGSTNYWIGFLGNPAWLKKLGVKESTLNRFEERILKFGFWLALLSWVPVIGDPLTVGLGFFKASWWPVLILMSFGKIIRYLVILSPWIFG